MEKKNVKGDGKMAHNVKCKFCDETFNRDIVQAVKVSARRYAHLRCVPEEDRDKYELVPLAESKDEDLIQLEEYIMKLFHVEYINPRIRKQIKQYHDEYNYSYSGILKSLQYFYGVKNNSTEKYGETLGIVPYIYDDAKKYFYALYMAKISNEQVQVQKEARVVEYVIPQPIQRKREPKLFRFEEDE